MKIVRNVKRIYIYLITTFIILIIIITINLLPKSIIGRYINELTKEILKMKPDCTPINKYNLNSADYWQYYGYSGNKELNEESLSSILKISTNQENEIGKIHKSILNDLIPSQEKFINLIENGNELKGKGIVFVSGDDYYWLTIMSIKYIRDELKDDIPIEIYIPERKKKDFLCGKIEMVFKNVECLYFDDYISKKYLEKIKGYQYKSIAMLLSKFSDILFLDSDNLPLVKPIEMFNIEEYKTQGLVLWPDFWKRSTNFKFYKMANIEKMSDVIMSTPSIESGQILINKKTHLKSLILSYYYNLYGPDYFYPIFSQGFPGEGDKESLYLASRVLNEKSFLMSGIKTKSVGFKDSKGIFSGQGILQRSPKLEYWFLHLNYPKLELEKFIDDGFFKMNHPRFLTTVRYAQKNSMDEENFRQLMGRDLESKLWEIMYQILKVDFKGFQVLKKYGNDEAADFCMERYKELQGR